MEIKWSHTSPKYQCTWEYHHSSCLLVEDPPYAFFLKNTPMDACIFFFSSTLVFFIRLAQASFSTSRLVTAFMWPFERWCSNQWEELKGWRIKMVTAFPPSTAFMQGMHVRLRPSSLKSWTNVPFTLVNIFRPAPVLLHSTSTTSNQDYNCHCRFFGPCCYYFIPCHLHNFLPHHRRCHCCCHSFLNTCCQFLPTPHRSLPHCFHCHKFHTWRCCGR